MKEEDFVNKTLDKFWTEKQTDKSFETCDSFEGNNNLSFGQLSSQGYVGAFFIVTICIFISYIV